MSEQNKTHTLNQKCDSPGKDTTELQSENIEFTSLNIYNRTPTSNSIHCANLAEYKEVEHQLMAECAENDILRSMLYSQYAINQEISLEKDELLKIQSELNIRIIDIECNLEKTNILLENETDLLKDARALIESLKYRLQSYQKTVEQYDQKSNKFGLTAFQIMYLDSCNEESSYK